MGRQQHDMLSLAQSDEPRAQQRAPNQIERFYDFSTHLVREPDLAFPPIHVRQVHNGHLHAQGGRDAEA
jgi:hypothetical protein